MSRKKFTESEKGRWVSRFQGQGKSAAAFYRKFDLPYGSFMAWRRLYNGKGSRAKSTTLSDTRPPFIEVTVDSSSNQTARVVSPMPVVELSLGSGIVLRVFTPNHEQA
jgi:hypothetical protein